MVNKRAPLLLLSSPSVRGRPFHNVRTGGSESATRPKPCFTVIFVRIWPARAQQTLITIIKNRDAPDLFEGLRGSPFKGPSGAKTKTL